jgi:hypothetical protein
MHIQALDLARAEAVEDYSCALHQMDEQRTWR